MNFIATTLNESQQYKNLPALHKQKYLRKVLFRACCKTLMVQDECIKEVKTIFDCLLSNQTDKTNLHLTIMGIFMLLKDNNLYVALTLLTKLFTKSSKCAKPFISKLIIDYTISLDINSFHHMLHNQDIQRIYRKSRDNMLPTTLNQLFQRLYEVLERNELFSKIKLDSVPVREQYQLYMKMISVGQGSGNKTLPSLKMDKIQEDIGASSNLIQGETFNLEGDNLQQDMIKFLDNDESEQGESQNFIDSIVSSAMQRGKSQAINKIEQSRIQIHESLPFKALKDAPNKLYQVNILQKAPLPYYLKDFHERMMDRMQRVTQDKNFSKLNLLAQQTRMKSFKLPVLN